MQIKLDIKALERLIGGVDELSHADAEVERLALNRTLDFLYTRVVRAVATASGMQQKRVRAKLRKVPARSGTAVAAIVARDSYTSLKDFHPAQRKGGVVASPWGKRHLFPGTFISPQLGGHVFRRVHGTGKVKKLFGPALPKELVKDETSGPLVAQAIATQFPMHLQFFHDRALAKVKEKHDL